MSNAFIPSSCHEGPPEKLETSKNTVRGGQNGALVLVPGFQTDGQEIENILTCLDNYYEEKSQRVEIPESSSTVQEKSL